MNTMKTISLLLAAAVSIAGCKGADGTNGTNGTSGTNGTNGASCTAVDNHDGTSKVSCTDGTSVTITNGTNGANGVSCTMVNNNNGTRTITCGTVSVVVNDASIDYTVLTPDEAKAANMAAVITGITIPADGRPVVNLKISERHGYGVRGLAVAAAGSTPGTLSTTANLVNFRVALLKLVPGSAPVGAPALGVNGSANDTWVSYMPRNSTSSASTESATPATGTGGLLTDNGDGTYTYRFLKNVTAGIAAGGVPAVAYDAAAVHRLVVLVYQSGNPFAPIDLVKEFVPSTGADVTGQNDKVDPAACLECHTTFRAQPDATGQLGAGGFHGGSRYDIRTCAACHNDQQRNTAIPGTSTTSPRAGDAQIQANGTWTGALTVVNGEAVVNLPVFIHKIHMGEDLSLKGGSYTGLSTLWDITYPQDIRNCQKCHRAPAAQAANWKTKPSRRSCNACHDQVSFAATVPAGRVAHSGGAQADDTLCTTCHKSDDTTLTGKPQHLSVQPPDSNALWFPGGTNGNTNAAWIAAAGVVPTGASVVTYVVSSVGVDATGHPQLVFKLTNNGADVVFNANPTSTSGGTELIPNFVGSPSAYFVWAVPQDGIALPADFNESASGYIRNLWNGSASGTGAGTITGPVGGFYTLTLTGVALTANASMLQGGVGYTYGIPATQPLTQTNLPAYPTAPVTVTGNVNKVTGGLILATPDVWATASTGCTGNYVNLCTSRRGVKSSAASTSSIVSNAKCNACHVQLGVGPTFHAGQRNDSPTCAFCHKPNQTSSAWSANAKDFIHGIHGAGKRTVPFTWHAVSAVSTYAEVTYPGVLNKCEMCHNAGTYDFSAATTLAALPNMLASTVAVGRYETNPAINPGGYFSISPYVKSDLSVDYGYGFAAAVVAADVKYTFPDGVSGQQVNGTSTTAMQGGTVCTAAAPCSCSTTACDCSPAHPCTVSNTTTSATSGSQTAGVSTTAVQGSTTCTAAAPCTCTVAAPCVCSASNPCSTVSALSIGCNTANPCSITLNTDTTTVQGVPATFNGGGGSGALCTALAPCTCTTASTCVAKLQNVPATRTVAQCSAGYPCDAQGTTLVKSPIVAACSACHDSPGAIDHMQTNGGLFYEARAKLPGVANGNPQEQCLTCHGPNRLASIALVHMDRTP